MKINRTRPPDSRIERQIIMGMIVSTEFLTDIKPLYEPRVFNIDYARDVASWCIEYYDKYKVAPGKNIEEIFQSHVKNGMREEQVDLISDFLLSISDEYANEETLNVPYHLDEAEKHFRLTSLHKLRTDLGQCLTAGRLVEAEAMAKGYMRPTRPETEGVDPIGDIAVISEAFREDNRDGLFSLSGDLGKAIGSFHRGYLVGILGAPAVGKTWWLQQLALKPALMGYNVLFISMEMSRDQMVRRIQHSITGLPLRKFAGKLLIPVFDCNWNQDNSCNKAERVCNIGVKNGEGKKMDFNDAPKKYVPCTVCRGVNREYGSSAVNSFKSSIWHKEITREELDVKKAVNKAKRMTRNNVLRGNKLRLVEYPAGVLTMSALRAYLYNLEHYENFIPDVLVTDYAQKFAPEDKRQETRNQIRSIWEGHKSLAQEKHMLVATGSQTSAARSGRDAKRGDWGESIAPLELCDVGYIINQSDQEKKEGLMRVSIAKQRHEDYELSSEVKVLYSYKIGRSYLDSWHGK